MNGRKNSLKKKALCYKIASGGDLRLPGKAILVMLVYICWAIFCFVQCRNVIPLVPLGRAQEESAHYVEIPPHPSTWAVSTSHCFVIYYCQRKKRKN